jgi:DNA-binding PadR family transcriptional regulator
MSLPHVLLGLLSEEPHTGYELARAMREDLDAIWRAELSQIYPALARLRRAGFVHLKVLGPRRGPRRNLYRVTAAGRRELRRWLAVPPSPPGKDEGLARVAFFDVLSPAERRPAFLAQERALGQEVRRLRSSPSSSGYRTAARRGAIERLEAARRWLNAAAQEPAPPPSSTTTPSKKK